MKYLKFSPIVLVFAFLVYYYFGVYQPREQASSPQSQPSEQSTNTGQKQWDTKSDDQPPVAIKVTPTEFGQDAKLWKFAIVFDTHSESLDLDPTKVISLADDKGNTYQPTAWEGSEPGGHHREGVLVFKAIDPTPSFIELKIKNVGEVPTRSFKWDIK
jgi:hypothetical protein